MTARTAQLLTAPEVAALLQVKVLLTAEEAAIVTGYSERFLHELTKAGRIPCVRIGDTVRYRPATLEQFAADNERRDQEESRETPHRRVSVPTKRRSLGGDGHSRPRDSEREAPGGVVRPFPAGGGTDAG